MRHLYDAQIKISRLKTSSGNLRRYVATATADCALQPMGKDAASIRDGLYGSTYVAYVDEDVTAEKGDKVKDQNGVQYTVSDVIPRDYGAIPYKEIILKKS